MAEQYDAGDHEAGDEDHGDARQEPPPIQSVNQRGVSRRAEDQEQGVEEIHDGEILNSEVGEEEGITGASAESDAGIDQQINKQA